MLTASCPARVERRHGPLSTTHPTPTSRAVASELLITAIVLLALNLRGPIVAVSAVTGDIQADLGSTQRPRAVGPRATIGTEVSSRSEHRC